MLSHQISYNGYELYYDESGHDLKEAQRIINTLNYACFKHNDVQFIRIDIRYPDWNFLTREIELKIFNEFLPYLIKKCSGKNGTTYYRRSWELEEADHPHFHMFLLVCDRPELKYTHLLKEIDELFSLYVESNTGYEAKGMIHFCRINKFGDRQINGIIIKQNGCIDAENFRTCVQWATYLSENRGKEKIPKHYNRFTGSQLAPWVKHHDFPIP